MSADRTIRGAATRSRPGEPTYLVFCDVDETLIHCKSLLEFLDHYFAERYGSHGRRHAGRRAGTTRRSDRRRRGREEANALFYRAWRGEPLAEVRRSGRRWYVARRSALRLLCRRHANRVAPPRPGPRGRTGPGLRFVRRCPGPAGRGVWSGPHPVHPARRGGRGADRRGRRCTGDREGKRRAVRALLARHPHVDPADCHAYGDHVSDLPMLLEVGHPTVVGSPPHCWRGCGLPTARSSCERAVAVAGVRCPGKGCRYTLEQTKYLHEGL